MSLIIKMKFYSVSAFPPSFAAQFFFASLSYLTESPERSQNRMRDSLNNKTEEKKGKHGERCAKLLGDISKPCKWYLKPKRLILGSGCPTNAVLVLSVTASSRSSTDSLGFQINNHTLISFLGPYFPVP